MRDRLRTTAVEAVLIDAVLLDAVSIDAALIKTLLSVGAVLRPRQW